MSSFINTSRCFNSLLHDLDLSAPAVFVLGVQLQAAKFHSDLVSQLLLQTTDRELKPSQRQWTGIWSSW